MKQDRSPMDGTLLPNLFAAALLAPALRLIPRRTAYFAGRACWVSIPTAIPFILLDIWFLTAFMKNRRPGEGLREMMFRALGPVFGAGACAVFAAWMVFYCGFILRSGSERFVSTIYPSSHPWFFVAVMGGMGLAAALGRPERLARVAKVLLPAAVIILALVVGLSMTTMDFAELVPVKFSDAAPILKGSVTATNAVCALLTYSCFLEGDAPKKQGRFRMWAMWLIPVSIFLLLLCAATIGNFGSGLTADLNYPFFSMVRNIRILKTVERIEAIIVAMWVLPDFVLVSMLLIIASRSIISLLGYLPADAEKQPLLSMKCGRFVVPLCAAAACAVSQAIAPDAFALEHYSHTVIPELNMALIFVLLPVIFAVGKLRKTI